MTLAIRPKIYLETTLFNYYFLDDITRQVDIEATKKLFDEVEKGVFMGFVSPETLREIGNNPDARSKERMMEFIRERKLKPLAPNDFEGYEKLMERYIKAGVIPAKKRADARHIAIATTSGMDILVSWNQRHIVRYKTQSIINAINEEHNFPSIAINTPAEIISYEESNTIHN